MADTGYKFKLGCAVPEYEFAQALADGVRLFDQKAFVHIKESQEDDFWELTALFNLTGQGPIQFAIVGTLFENSVRDVGGRKL
jgi:hypothetical protein